MSLRRITSLLPPIRTHSQHRPYSSEPRRPSYHDPSSKFPSVFTEAVLDKISHRLKTQPRVALQKPAANFGEPFDPSKPVRRAAVLVPLVNWAPVTTTEPRTSGRKRASLVFSLRSSSLRNHGNQVSFPGGVMDPEDEGDPIKTALRETCEEIGIEKQFIQPLGLFHDVTSLNGIIVTPVVAYIPNWCEIATNHVMISEDEVQEIFEVALQDLVNPNIYSLDNLKRGVLPRYKVDPTRQEKDIWGMTAYISDWLLRTTLANLEPL